MDKSNTKGTASSGIGLGGVLFIVFLVLKLTETIDWSWWWVTAPLWIPFAIVVGVLLVIGSLLSLLVWLDKITTKKQNNGQIN